MNVAACFNYI